MRINDRRNPAQQQLQGVRRGAQEQARGGRGQLVLGRRDQLPPRRPLQVHRQRVRAALPRLSAPAQGRRRRRARRVQHLPERPVLLAAAGVQDADAGGGAPGQDRGL